jgi:hypothetical protein
MTVYVDDMRAPFGRMIMCHMIADSDDELHLMAARIGIARKCHQRPPKASHSHYDIALAMRAKAVKLGAIEITYLNCALMAVNRTRGNPAAPLVTPDEGRAILSVKFEARRIENG